MPPLGGLIVMISFAASWSHRRRRKACSPLFDSWKLFSLHHYLIKLSADMMEEDDRERSRHEYSKTWLLQGNKEHQLVISSFERRTWDNVAVRVFRPAVCVAAVVGCGAL